MYKRRPSTLTFFFLFLSTSSLLPKTNEPGNVTKLSDAAVIGINKSKFDDSIISSEINIVHIDIAHIDNYDTLHRTVIVTGMEER